MKILLDTCVLSEIGHPSGSAAVKQAVKAASSDELFVSVLTIGELTKGIAILPSGKRKNELLAWLDGLKADFSEHILEIDLETTVLWGQITARLQTIGTTCPAVDGLLAASAIRHNLHLMTRNTKHFDATGATIIDPWKR